MSGSILGKTAAAVGALMLGAAVLAGGAAAGVSGLLGGGGDGTGSQAGPAIPSDYLLLYESAATTCPGLSWTVLAAIGTIESDNGQSDAPGVRSGANSAHAEGPMQFLPATFAEYANPIPPGGVSPASPFNPADAIYAAARDLCTNGARGGTNILAAIYNYNHDDSYVTDVLTIAADYALPATATTTPAATAAVSYALAQLGTPYRWGGDSPGGFDCSGLTQAAYAAAGIAIPRTSEAQWSQLPHVPLDALEPGDLVFFYPGEFLPGLPGHVGLYIGNNEFIDAPHTGADVRIDNLADWPPPLGAARPTDLSQGI
ncbi:MAG: C40 family peptidase [Mycobacteriales bacterium]